MNEINNVFALYKRSILSLEYVKNEMRNALKNI